FFFKDEEVVDLYNLSSSYMNLNVFGPTKAIINGNLGEWEFSKADFKSPTEKCDYYWDDTKKQFTLGDFNALSNFLIINSGKAEVIDATVK
ncbi:hypothetical protein, partial [uncultured Flavobacterium sp.]|uniref:hypothetical protein n=1 Tax=uncultured Flavobacterium sp. TaxID=165435 RepID=UPI002615A89D